MTDRYLGVPSGGIGAGQTGGRTDVSDPEAGGGGRRPSPYDYTSLGFEVVAPVVLLMIAGYALDGWIDSEPWFLLGGALLGIALGMYNLFRRVLPPRDGGPSR